VIASALGTATVVNCNALNIRRGPGVSHEAFNHLLRGDVIRILENKGNWYQIEAVKGDKTVIGWVYGAYLDIR
jgi:uncharacterized protein YgiM (DUF1202 family)